MNVQRLIKDDLLRKFFYIAYICHYQCATDLCTRTGSCECNAGYSYKVSEADIQYCVLIGTAALQFHKSVHFKVLKSSNLERRNAMKKRKSMLKNAEGRKSGMSILAIEGTVFGNLVV